MPSWNWVRRGRRIREQVVALALMADSSQYLVARTGRGGTARRSVPAMRASATRSAARSARGRQRSRRPTARLARYIHRARARDSRDDRLELGIRRPTRRAQCATCSRIRRPRLTQFPGGIPLDHCATRIHTSSRVAALACVLLALTGCDRPAARPLTIQRILSSGELRAGTSADTPPLTMRDSG